MNPSFWHRRRVLVTGHTGFKGSWLSLILDRLGAIVTGYSLAPHGDHSLFESARVDRHINSVIADIQDLDTLRRTVGAAQPEVVIHLAAQSLVLTSYKVPVETFSTNVIGTANVLEATRATDTTRAVVVVTTDKVYRNREWLWPYRENDELGGRDPYSASKACAELVTSSYRESFLAERGVAVASARAGNVIGGGDWSADRVVPDFVRAVLDKRPMTVRNPGSVRPWQHLLEPLEGYLELAERLITEPKHAQGAWNFGPMPEAIRPVRQLVDDLAAAWGEGATWKHEPVEQPHEASTLLLDSTRARQELGWTQRLGYLRGVHLVAEWYKGFAKGDDLEATTLAQIDSEMSRPG